MDPRGRRQGALAALAIVLLAACSAPAAAAPSGAAAAKPNPATASAPAAAVGPDLPARWWQWTESFAPADNPIDDPAGSQCSLRQPAHFWFLAGTHGGSAVRSCTIPVGRAIYFPVINQVCEVTATESDAAALADCTSHADVATATLDGKP